MQYRNDRSRNPLSVLGYGCMRFTRNGNSIDLEKAEREVLRGVERGINYFDTAYLYPGNEEALGKITERNGIRDQIHIATKLPTYLVGKYSALDRYFNEELQRLRTNYIDYYLFHLLTDISRWNRLEEMGVRDWIAEKKADGQIRNIGFSFHGNTEMFLQILDAYDWDFCQIQYNYVDEETQAGRRGLQAAAAKGIPVIVMEPLRGGRLTDGLPKQAKEQIAQEGGGLTPAELGLRWLWDQPEVTCVLSGMNSLDMVEENCRIADAVTVPMLTEDQRALLERVRETIGRLVKVPCTGCRYCMPCPQGVDIPAAFQSYNAMYTEDKKRARLEYIQVVGLRAEKAFASQCIGCGKCEKHCPQGIPIRRALAEADKALRPLPYKIRCAAERRFVLRK